MDLNSLVSGFLTQLVLVQVEDLGFLDNGRSRESHLFHGVDCCLELLALQRLGERMIS